jgi:hypothetical protein
MIYSGHRSGLFKWHWAKAPAPQKRKPLRANVGQTDPGVPRLSTRLARKQ